MTGDDRDFAVALQQAKADVATAQANIADRQAALDAQQSVIDSARATIGVDQSQETFAEQDNHRYTTLAVDGWGTVHKAQEAASRIAASRAAVARDAAALANATKQIEVLTAQLAAAQAGLAHAQAVQAQAELNLSYTTIVAPTDGVVRNRTLRVGQHVQAGRQLMSVVPAELAYIVANYKETSLRVTPAPAPDTSVSLASWIAVLASMIGAFMAILNIQITNASLLDIEGHRHRRRQRSVDLYLLPDRRDHRDPADRLSQQGVLIPPLHAGEWHPVSVAFDSLCLHQ